MHDGWNIRAGRLLVARTSDGLSNHGKDTCQSRADRSSLIKAQLSALNVATKRVTSDKTEATRFSQCAHDQRRRLEAEDCDSIRCAQFIPGGSRRIRPSHCLAHARPTMCCIRLVQYNEKCAHALHLVRHVHTIAFVLIWTALIICT